MQAGSIEMTSRNTVKNLQENLDSSQEIISTDQETVHTSQGIVTTTEKNINSLETNGIKTGANHVDLQIENYLNSVKKTIKIHVS